MSSELAKFCGRTTRAGGSCRRPAGWGTDHPGQGACKLHGGASPIKHGRYSAIKRKRVSELIEQFQADPDPLNLLPELAAARALFQDYIERYDQTTEALLAWHESYQAGNDDQERKPRQILDVSGAHRLVAEVTKIAKRIEDVRAQNAISRADFYRVLSEMGRCVDLSATELLEPTVREDFLKRVHEAWMGIRLT